MRFMLRMDLACSAWRADPPVRQKNDRQPGRRHAFLAQTFDDAKGRDDII